MTVIVLSEFYGLQTFNLKAVVAMCCGKSDLSGLSRAPMLLNVKRLRKGTGCHDAVGHIFT